MLRHAAKNGHRLHYLLLLLLQPSVWQQLFPFVACRRNVTPDVLCVNEGLYEINPCVFPDPEEHPQQESYWGHVNPIGPRACYDEGKRVAETMCYAYQKQVRFVQIVPQQPE